MDPTLAYWTHSGNIVFMVLLGGFASFFGPLVGAFAFIFLQDTVMSVFPYWRLIFGAMLAFIVIFAPGGLMGLFARRRPGRGLAPVILEAHDLRKRYGAYVALDGVSLAVREGEFVSIIGPNGAGKSTLINLLTGVLAPSEGRVRFKDRDIGGIGPVGARPPRHGPELPARPDLPRPHRARDAAGRGGRRGSVAAAGSSPRSRADRQVQAEALEVADLFGLADRAHSPARALPQGDKKLLDVASAFALRPEIILLDEPTSGVSTADKHAIMEILVGAARRIGLTAIIQVEHDMDIVFGYSDRIIALHQGQVLADATPAAIRADARVVDMVIGRGAR